MTLIAAVSPYNHPLLISDVMVSASRLADPFFELALPTGAYISPQSRRSMLFTPVGFTRKICELNSNLVLMCAGDGLAAKQLAGKLRDWFHNTDIDRGSLQDFMHRHSGEFAGTVSAFVMGNTAQEHVMALFGERESGEDRVLGRFVAAGSGAEYFKRTIHSYAQLGLHDLSGRRADRGTKAGLAGIYALELTSLMLGRELHLGETFAANFGGAFEVTIPTASGFKRFEDLQYMFMQVLANSNGRYELYTYPRIIRQWYEQDCLCVTATGQGEFADHNWLIPGIFTENLPIPSYPETVAPNYVVLNVLYRLPGVAVDESYVLGKQFVRFEERDEKTLSWTFTRLFQRQVRARVQQLLKVLT
jgi:hypothetical protein